MLSKEVLKVCKLVSLLLVLVMVFSGCGGTEVERYLKKYAKPVDFEQGLDDKTFGNADDYRFFFGGEVHQQTMIYPAKKMMLQYLHEDQGVNYLLMEEGMGAGLLIDHYIQTGDEEILNFALECKKGLHTDAEPERDLWQWLYEYNSQQPEDKKIHAIGIDAEINRLAMLKGISLLIEQPDKAPEEWKILFEKAMEDDQQAYAKLVTQISPLEEYEETLRNIFGENYEIFVQIYKYLFLLIEYVQSGGNTEVSDEFYNFRDEHSLENIRFLLNTLPENAKFFAQFGAGHTYQKSVDEVVGSKNFHRLGTRLNEEGSPLKGQVCSILYMVEHKSSVTEKNEPLFFYDWFDKNVFQDYFEQTTFIPLDMEGSPFTQEIEGMIPKEEGAALTDYFQKILILPNSEEAPKIQ